jgi:carbonic anhydrase/acetyltransferase-like protein (isoleucine patch superfamily)
MPEFDESARLIGEVSFGAGPSVGPFVVVGGPSYQHETPSSRDKDEPRSRTVIGHGCALQAFSYIGAGSIVGDDFRADAHAYVGTGCRLGDRVVVEYGGRIYNRAVVGDDTVVGGFVCNEAQVGARCLIQGSLVHARTAPSPERCPTIEDDVMVGFNAVVIGGVVVAARSVVAAGAVLLTSTEAGFMYAGVPARKIGPAEWG